MFTQFHQDLKKNVLNRIIAFSLNYVIVFFKLDLYHFGY